MARVTFVEVQPEDLTPLGFPAQRLKLKLRGRDAFVFTMTAAAREKLTDVKFREIGQTLGNLVHPAQAVMMVLPDGAADLRAYEVIGT